MAMMTKMRDHAHVFIIAFVVIFVAFWVVSDLDVSSIMQGSYNEIGNINGQPITYQDFQARVEQVAEQRRQQNEGKDLSENDYTSIREQVWNDFVTQGVIENAIEEFNITVSDQEITDWIRGSNPPQQLTQYFVDSLGAFNSEAYKQFLDNPGTENQQALLQIEDQLRSELLRIKLTNVINSSVIISEGDIRAKYVEQNTEFVASYTLFDPRIIAATDTAAPTDAENEQFYQKYKERYKIEDLRKLNYVLFPDVPSKDDSNSVRSELTTLTDLAEGGMDFLELVNENSEVQYADNWVARDQVSAPVANEVFGQPVGSIVGPLAGETGFSIYKVIEQREGEKLLYRASHILLRTDGGQDDATQKAKAEEAYAKAKAGEDFGALVTEYSEEPGASERAGDLSWFTKERMVSEFSDPVFKSKVGQILGPVKSQFGYHVIEVTGRSTSEIKLAEIRMSVRAGSRTKDDLFENARNFAYFATENGFENEAANSEFEILETTEFARQSSSYIPGIGSNPALIKFAFENSVGEISEVHRAANGYVVSRISDARDAGYRPLDEVREQIKTQVVFERQIHKALEKAQSVASGKKSLEQIVAANPQFSITTTPPFKLSAGVPNIGPDQAFIGTMMSLDVNEVSVPFRGLRGVFVLRLDSRSAFDETAYNVKKEELRQQELQSRQNAFIQSWLEQKREEMSIVDNRDRFFR